MSEQTEQEQQDAEQTSAAEDAGQNETGPAPNADGDTTDATVQG